MARGERATLLTSLKRGENGGPRSRARLALLVLALAGTGWACSYGSASEARKGNEAESKQVLALQAFLPDRTSKAIRETCLRAAAIPGANVAFARGAVPHVTLSAWRVSDSELETAIAIFRERSGRDLAPVTIACRLVKREEGETLSWYLLPRESAREMINRFRRRSMAHLDFRYEDFSGRSHEDWWPHLTLFSVPLARAEQAHAIAVELESIDEIRLSKVGLVGFQSGIQTLAVTDLE